MSKEMSDNKIKQGLKCCTEFLCGECPYQRFDSDEYKLQCIHKLIVDINKLVQEIE